MKKIKEDVDIAGAMSDLNKKYGENTIVKLSEAERVEVSSMPTGSFSLDHVLGCGGLPRGRIIEVYGLESSGKSTLCLFLVAQLQACGYKCVWVDAENAFDTQYSQNVGVNTDDLYISQPTYGEEGLEVVRGMAKTGKIDFIVVDSVAALVPKKEIDEGISKETIALQARMMSKMMRILASEISRTKAVVIFINQLRSNIGAFGKPNITPGGRALKFFSSVRLEVALRKGSKIWNKEDEQIGSWITVTAQKNKVGIPFKRAEMEIYFGVGIDLAGDLFDNALKDEIITKKGNTYSYGEEKLGVGREQSKEKIKGDPKLYSSIYDKLTISRTEDGKDGQDEEKSDGLVEEDVKKEDVQEL